MRDDGYERAASGGCEPGGEECDTTDGQGHGHAESRKGRDMEKGEKKPMLSIDALTLDYAVNPL
ncbi:hypothetical protein FOMPIDRAFT_83026 [Fomitopsis schrenkii]|uniref:Uncharacterized protein n=1 Tax=Fomitopsis schrenkii TaxID=2126942 RepID=S8E119_FOMSC|nr:hypothetical protein FOMPIDRAFT_83026 [Fomitopsis schrenkii]